MITIQALGSGVFDREINSKLYLTVEARDNKGAGNRNTVQVVINLLDANDNAPVFVHQKYEARLLENSHDFENPLFIEARDADLAGTPNSNITYAIFDGEYRRNFSLDPVTGKMSLHQPIDFEQLSGGDSNIRSIYLTIVAADAGSPNMLTKVPLVVYVHDVNDFQPVFDEGNYEAAVYEDLAPGATILQVKAFDFDGSSPNNAIVYRIQDGARDKFTVSPETGVLTVALGASLDPDLTDPKLWKYSLTIVALDGGIGEQQMQGVCTVNITVLDVNNKPPTFVEPEVVYIRENTPVGTYVYRMVATDLDAKPKLRYFIDTNHSEARTEDGVLVKLTDYDFISAFELNPVDGLVRVSFCSLTVSILVIRNGHLLQFSRSLSSSIESELN